MQKNGCFVLKVLINTLKSSLGAHQQSFNVSYYCPRVVYVYLYCLGDRLSSIQQPVLFNDNCLEQCKVSRLQVFECNKGKLIMIAVRESIKFNYESQNTKYNVCPYCLGGVATGCLTSKLISDGLRHDLNALMKL